MESFIKINDWEIKRFLSVILSVQLGILGLIGLDAIGLQVSILRQLIVFIYLTFVPGIIILRILKLHKLGNVETLLYTTGLSLAILMFTGLFMNTVYPIFGISRPISTMPLIITISMVVLILCILCYVRDKDFSNPNFINIRDVLSPPALFLCLIPFLAVFGTYLVNFHHNNILLMLLIVILVLIVLLIAFDKFISENLYPLAVFIVAISLLYYRWLISSYLTGWDVHVEYYFSNLVKMNSIWVPTIPNNVNAMLSVVMLPSIYSILLNMPLTWVFKIVDPLLFSLVPFGLYRIFQKQTNEKVAFLSCFFFVSFFEFYSLSPGRQWIAELFVVLLILLMIDKNMDKIKRSFLFIVFGISLAISHYGLSYIYMFSLIAVWLILIFRDSLVIQRLRGDFHTKFSKYKRGKTAFAGNLNFSKTKNETINPTFILLFITFTIAWYMYVSSSSPFNTIVNIGNQIASSIFTEFLNPEVAEGISFITQEMPSPLHSASKYLHLLTQFFIFVGILVLFLKRDGMKFEKEYKAFSFVNFGMSLADIAVPYFGGALNTARLYQITLIFLAPFCVIGGIIILWIVSKIVGILWTEQHVRSSLKVLSVFFAVFLLFNSGFIYELAKDSPGSISLSQESIKKYGNVLDKVRLYKAYFPEQDIFGVKWISRNRNNESKIYADFAHKILPFTSYGMIPNEYVLTNTTIIKKNSYIYLGYLNTCYGIIDREGDNYWNITDISSLLNEMSCIYSNGGAEVYYR